MTTSTDSQQTLTSVAQGDAPVLEQLVAMNLDSMMNSGLDEVTYHLVRLAALVALPATAASADPPVPGTYQQNDATGFHAVLPPGTNGLDNLLQLAAFQATSTRPPHNDDQWDPYANLLHASPGLDWPDRPSSSLPAFLEPPHRPKMLLMKIIKWIVGRI